MKNLTLAIDEKLLDAARAYAKSRGTTVNALVRDHLSRIATQEARQEEARQRLIELIDKSTARLGPRFKWSRNELYESPMFPGHEHTPVRRRRKGR